MKIALDVHGVLNHSEQIKDYTIGKLSRYELYVISGKPVKEIQQQLIELGYPLIIFDGIYSVIDYIGENFTTERIWKDDKGWWCQNDQLWWKIKSYICKQLDIDILIDDNLKYRQGYLQHKLCDANILFKGEVSMENVLRYCNPNLCSTNNDKRSNKCKNCHCIGVSDSEVIKNEKVYKCKLINQGLLRRNVFEQSPPNCPMQVWNIKMADTW